MAGVDHGGMRFAGKKNHAIINRSSQNSPSLFNRSLTVNSKSPRATAAEDPSLFGDHNSHVFRRNGSIKTAFVGKVRKLCLKLGSSKRRSIFGSSQSSSPEILSPASSVSPNTYSHNAAVVIYFTSLRGVRRTFQDCHSVRMIFRGFRVSIDERDISMDMGYKRELLKAVGEEGGLSLPQVFIKGRYIGGADAVRHLLEAGELARLLKGLPLRPMEPCDACGDLRFILCMECHGSRKVFSKDNGDVPQRCHECNENGLVRCPLCCAV